LATGYSQLVKRQGDGQRSTAKAAGRQATAPLHGNSHGTASV